MNAGQAFALAAAAAAGVIGLLIAARRRAPRGGFFVSHELAGSVYNVLGTAFAVILAFVIFLAFESYSAARQSALQEAAAVTELYRTAPAFASSTGIQLQGELVCYADAVVRDEWPAMRHQESSARVDAWVESLETTIQGAAVEGAKQSAAYTRWLEAASDRRDGRRGRLAEAAPFVPQPLWLVLLVGAVLLVAYTLSFADPQEHLVVQAFMVGSVTVIVVLGLLLVHFLDRPYENRAGSIKPIEMTRTLHLLEIGQRASGIPTPCDAAGQPAAG